MAWSLPVLLKLVLSEDDLAKFMRIFVIYKGAIVYEGFGLCFLEMGSVDLNEMSGPQFSFLVYLVLVLVL